LRKFLLSPFALLLIVAPAHAQEGARPANTGSAADGDFVIVGIGPAMVPDYEGSNDYGIYPTVGAIGRVEGYSFSVLGDTASIDLLRDKAGPGWDVQLGPAISIGLNRVRRGGIGDARVRALHTVGTAVTLGGYAGVVRQGVVTSDYDRLSLSVSVNHDVAGAYGGTTVTPEINYMTPLSRKALVAFVLTAVRADRRYADAYFSITPADSLASGLPTFTARGGWKNWSLGMATSVSLTGDLTHGLSAVGGVMYTRLLNDFAASPITSIAGSRDQWMAGLGLAYTF
jgi:outer membrane scaffolding protein for murein synthesis (MipA/OmpV family)